VSNGIDDALDAELGDLNVYDLLDGEAVPTKSNADGEDNSAAG